MLSIELGAVTEAQARMPPLAVTIACEGDTTRIEIKDPLTDKSLERSIPSPPPSEPGSERVIALAASQLFVASWLELLVPTEEPAAPAPEVRPARAAAHALVEKRVVVAEPRRVVLGLAVDARVRDPEDPFATFGGAIEGGLRLSPRLVALVLARFEAGRAERDIGVVDLRAVFIGGGAAVDLYRMGDFSLGASAFVCGGWMSLSGRDSPQTGGDAAENFTGEAWLSIGPALRLGAVTLGLAAMGGASLQSPVGTVGGPDPGVQPGGPWAGVSLGARYQLP